MKEHFNAILRSFAAALCSASLCLLTIALMLALYDIERTFFPACALWAILLLVQAIASEIMVSRSATMLVYLSVNAILVFLGARLVVENTLFVPGSHGFPMLLGWMVSACGMHLAYAAQKLPESNFFVRYADVLIAAIVFYLASVFALHESFHAQTLGFSLLALLLAMVTTAALRAGGESDSVIRGTGLGGWLVLGALVLICLLLTSAVITLSSGHVDSLVSVVLIVWQRLCAICSFLFTAFVRFIALFVGKPKAYRQNLTVQTAETPDMAAMEIIDAPGWIVYIFIALIIGLIIFALVVILHMLHGTKLTRSGRTLKKRKVTRQSHFLRALRELIAKAAERIAFEIAYRRHRHTPQGLYVLARRTGMLHKFAQRPYESGGAYLRRYHKALLERSMPSSLDVLAMQLDAALYGGQSIRLSTEEYETFAAQIASLHALKPKAQA